MDDARLSERYGRLHDPIPQPERWACGFGDTRVTPRCGREAIWHGTVMDEEHTTPIAMMECCDEHRPAMELSADYIHEMDTPCGVPGSRFHWGAENYCVLPETESALEAMCPAEVPA